MVLIKNSGLLRHGYQMYLHQLYCCALHTKRGTSSLVVYAGRRLRFFPATSRLDHQRNVSRQPSERRHAVEGEGAASVDQALYAMVQHSTSSTDRCHVGHVSLV